MIRQVLKEKFLSELTGYEKLFFLRAASGAIENDGYPPSEDLFHYCYFLTLRHRLANLGAAEGIARVLLAEGIRDVEEAAALYRRRLEAARPPAPDKAAGRRFIGWLSG